jgi:type IV fimbrial biogenesis protein FimT
MPATRQGFTLPELLVTLGLVAVLATLAVPGFGALADAWALRAASGALLSGLAEARLAALARGEEVRLCPSLAGRTCFRGAAGEFIVHAGDGPGVRVLRVGHLTGRVELSANRPAASYYPWPRSASPVTLTLCAVRQRARSLRVIVSQGGRPRVEHAASC